MEGEWSKVGGERGVVEDRDEGEEAARKSHQTTFARDQLKDLPGGEYLAAALAPETLPLSLRGKGRYKKDLTRGDDWAVKEGLLAGTHKNAPGLPGGPEPFFDQKGERPSLGWVAGKRGGVLMFLEVRILLGVYSKKKKKKEVNSSRGDVGDTAKKKAPGKVSQAKRFPKTLSQFPSLRCGIER